MKLKSRPFMLWGFEKQSLLSAIKEAIAHFEKKYKDYPYSIREIGISHNAEYPTEEKITEGNTKDVPVLSYKGILIRKDQHLFSKNNLTIVFDEKEKVNGDY